MAFIVPLAFKNFQFPQMVEWLNGNTPEWETVYSKGFIPSTYHALMSRPGHEWTQLVEGDLFLEYYPFEDLYARFYFVQAEHEMLFKLSFISLV